MRRKVFALVVGSDFRHLLFFGGCDYNFPVDFACHREDIDTEIAAARKDRKARRSQSTAPSQN